jgi:hypothetical protein
MSRKLKPFSVTLAWGQRDEGLYHWAGRARDLDHATQLAREEMDSSYNEQYAKPNDRFADEMRRGKEAGEETTDYVVSDYAEGANEFAAPELLKALKRVNDTYILEAADQKMVETAIARGEARI